jgi:ParB family chromosome partitioning protein
MSQTPKRGLGRGFEALISQDFDKSLLLTSEDRIEKIPLDQLKSNPYQPRKHFDKTALEELSASIKLHGVIQPLVISPSDNGYILIAGERRWRASKLAGLKTIPAIVKKREELEQLEIALIENVQRVDLTPLEQAISIARLRDEFNFSYKDIAKRLGKAVSTVNNTARLLNLPDDARDALIKGLISEGHARAILAISGDDKRQNYLLKSIIDNGWSVRQAERFVVSVKSGTRENEKVKEHVNTETPATKALSMKLKTPVLIRRTAHGGRIEISFSDDDELSRLIKLFN